MFSPTEGPRRLKTRKSIYEKVLLIMGQKTNAISLRLNINRNFDSCWFEDKSFEYSKLLQQDLKIREYIKSLFLFVGVHTGRISIQIFPKKLIIHYYFHDTIRSTNPDGSKSDLGRRQATMQGSKKYQIGSGASITAGEVLLSSDLETSKAQNEKNRSMIIPFNLNSFDFSKSKLIGQGINSRIEDLNELNRMQFFQFLTGTSGPENFKNNINTIDSTENRSLSSSEITGINKWQISRADSISSTSGPSTLELKKRFFIKCLLANFYFSQNKNLFQIQNFLKFSHYFLEAELSSKMLSKRSRTGTFGSVKQNISGQLTSSTFRESEFKTLNLLENYKLEREDFLLDMNLKHIEFILRKNFQSNTIIIPKKIYSKYKSAQFICEYVSQRIQQNIPFRQIYKQLVLEIKKFDEIQGMRIVCSGRLGGVEMATIESRKYGQTSLHVFSSKIDFATGQAYTLFGLIGVKVWICFR